MKGLRKGRRITNKNLGERIQEVAKFQEKTKVYVNKTQDAYIDTSIKYAKQVANQLERCLQEVQNNPEKQLEVADRIFDILIEANYTKLEKAKEDFEFYYDWNEKFNS